MRPSRMKRRITLPLQNRVDPFGEIHAVEARPVHGQPRRHPRPRQQDLAQAALDDQGLDRLRLRLQECEREVMGRNARAAAAPAGRSCSSSTRLPRSLPATAPASACRREAAKDFVGASARLSALPNRRFPRSTSGCTRSAWPRGGRRSPVRPAGTCGKLPDGAMVFDGQRTYAIRGGKALRWSFAGYDRSLRAIAISACRRRSRSSRQPPRLRC